MPNIQEVVRLNLSKFTAAEAKRIHIETARAGLASFLAGQGSEAPAVDIIVDGHAASSENEVKPFGVIVYRFRRMRQIAAFALSAAVRISPEKSGRYKNSWFIKDAGGEIAPTAVPQNAIDLWIVNDQPYARKIQVRGARIVGVPPGIVERVRQMVLAQYRSIVEANVEYISLAGAHVLRTSGSTTRRKRNLKGRALTYPALHLTSKIG